MNADFQGGYATESVKGGVELLGSWKSAFEILAFILAKTSDAHISGETRKPDKFLWYVSMGSGALECNENRQKIILNIDIDKLDIVWYKATKAFC